MVTKSVLSGKCEKREKSLNIAKTFAMELTDEPLELRIAHGVAVLADFLNFQFDERPRLWKELLRHHYGLYRWVKQFQWLGTDQWEDGALGEVQWLQEEVRTDIE